MHQLILLFIFLSLIFFVTTIFLAFLIADLSMIYCGGVSLREREKKGFFYLKWHRLFFPDDEKSLFFVLQAAQYISRFIYVFFLTLSLFILFQNIKAPLFLWVAVLLFLVTFLFAGGEILPYLLKSRLSSKFLFFASFCSSFFLILISPLVFVWLKVFPGNFSQVGLEVLLPRAKREIVEIIQRAKISPQLALHEKKLIESVLTFKERIAREIMVPRVDLFCLSADTTIRESAKLIEEEGYSRVPVYLNSLDNIVGVLMYKDLLKKFMEYENKGGDPSILDAPISTIQKAVLYTPETKKISNLLLEFRKTQLHLAIVVDEYGGTEGVVTIEDILEEIVGEIADEYDEEEELFFPQPDGSWIVDGRMTILDLEEQLGVKIPQEGDYDTLAGFIFHRAGTIPTKGFVLFQENFKLEVLRSDERRVKRVRIRPLASKEEEKKE